MAAPEEVNGSVNEARIKSLIADYVEAMTRGDEKLLAATFHPRAMSVGTLDGTFEWQTVSDLAAGFAEAAQDGPPETPPHRIEQLFLTPTTAMAIVTTIWGGRSFTDILTFAKADGRWWIVQNLFHQPG